MPDDGWIRRDPRTGKYEKPPLFNCGLIVLALLALPVVLGALGIVAAVAR